MVEKTIDLKDIELVQFLGVKNKNIQGIEEAFPKTKIISRGNKISIKGNKDQLLEVEKIINSLISHFEKYGSVNIKVVQSHIKDGYSNEDNEPIVYGSNGKRIIAKTKNQKKIVKLHKKNDLLFVIGPAGTGKTYVSVALGVKALKEKKVKKIIITRPVVEAGENLGFLPGDLREKLDPYMQPLYDALKDMIPSEKLKKYLDDEIIQIAPLAFMRGRTLDNAFVILDEGQNTSSSQMKMFLTRMGKNAKFIVTGDPGQMDLPKGISGINEAIKLLDGTKGVAIVSLDDSDVVRNKLVKKIIEAYKNTPNK